MTNIMDIYLKAKQGQKTEAPERTQLPEKQDEIINVEAEEIPNHSGENLFNWDIKEHVILKPDGSPAEGWKGISRDDNGQLLHIARETYNPTPNTYFSESVLNIAEVTGMELAKTECLNGGRRVMAVLKDPEGMQAAGHSFNTYMIIGNSHDGSSAFFTGLTSHMLRCNNQFTQQNQQLRAYHTTTNRQQIELIRQQFTFFRNAKQALSQRFETFAQTPVSGTEEIIKRVFDLDTTDPDELSTRRQNQILELDGAIEREFKELGNNALGLFQGVTYFTSNIRKQKERAFGNSNGMNAEINRRAYNFINEIL